MKMTRKEFATLWKITDIANEVGYPHEALMFILSSKPDNLPFTEENIRDHMIGMTQGESWPEIVALINAVKAGQEAHKRIKEREHGKRKGD